ncbi:hypothetical protein E4W59_20370 [Klebsiella pneumoniae]|nr:hypothetical protein [Klebsiella pneumoniae]
MLPTPGMSAVPHAKKKPVHAYELFLKYGGEGGIDSLRSPLLGPSLGLAPAGPTQALFKNAPGVFVGAARSQAGSLSNWLRQLSNPGRGFSSPRRVPHAKKKPVHAYELFLKYGGEGGLTRFARPCGAARLLRARSVQLALPVVEPWSGVLIPPSGCHMRKKSPYMRTSSS